MKFHQTLSLEVGKLYSIVLEEKGGYSIKALWENQIDLSKGINRHLSKFVKENIIEAAKCLVLERYTATGFHAMRCVEKVTRKYYELITGHKPPYKDSKGREYFKMLGGIAQELLDKNDSLLHSRKACGELPIIAPMVKGLCKLYRDPLSHPEIVKLNELQAITTLRQMIELISLIIIDAKSGGPHLVIPWKRGCLF